MWGYSDMAGIGISLNKFLFNLVNAVYFNDLFRPDFALSLRKLNSNSDKCIRVRRGGDNVEKDIGFAGNYIDLSELLLFIGEGDGFVTVWYDQSDFNRNAVQETESLQPKIVESGSIIYQDEKPAIYFNGNNLFTINDYVLQLSQNNASVFAVFKRVGGASSYLLAEADNISAYSSNYILGHGVEIFWVNSASFGNYSNNIQQLIGITYDGTNFRAFNGGQISGAAGNAIVNLEQGNKTGLGGYANGTTPQFLGYLWEMVGFRRFLSDEIENISNNINEFYNIW